MSKRYAVINQNGEVVNTIVWDGTTQIGNVFHGVDGEMYSPDELIFVEEPYASPKDIILEGKVYRLSCPEHHTVDVTKAKKIDRDGKIKKPKAEELKVLFTTTKVPEFREVEDKITEVLNKIEGESDAV